MKSHGLVSALIIASALHQGVGCHGHETSEYLEFVKGQAAALRQGDGPPANLGGWEERSGRLRKQLSHAWGEFPAEDAPLLPRKLGEISRDGYRVEKVIFQTYPGVWMTANAYVPSTPGKRPALLMVHGHWRGAKQDPAVQARCIGAAKLGFFVLAVDAFGAGERGVGEALGEYHGEMTAATLLPTGLALAGIQVYENMRAIDYVGTRPEVDTDRIGVTGASGGGNQTMYAAAWDRRIKAAVPVCSVGNYQAYLGAACCLCEVVPGALRFTEEWAILGMTAPRSLMVVNATRDVRQFSVAEAEISMRQAKQVYTLLGESENLRHVSFASGHDYSQPMREAMYGWMKLHLEGEGDGTAVNEPAVVPEDPETLRCFPGESRPDDWLTLPGFAAREGRRIVEGRDVPETAPGWLNGKARLRRILADELLGGLPQVDEAGLKVDSRQVNGRRVVAFSPEPGVRLEATVGAGDGNRLCIVLDLEGGETAAGSELAKRAEERGCTVITLDLRATGKHASHHDKIGRAPDHTSAEWGLWIGRPLIGQWVAEIRALITAVELSGSGSVKGIEIAGVGPAGLVAIVAGILDDRITRVGTERTLATYISEMPYEGQRLGTIIPGVLPAIGDIPHLAALLAPKPLQMLTPVGSNNRPMSRAEVRENFAVTRAAYSLESSEAHFDVRQ